MKPVASIFLSTGWNSIRALILCWKRHEDTPDLNPARRSLRVSVFRFMPWLFPIFMSVTPFLLQGCVFESMDDCTSFEGTLRIILPDGSDITSDNTGVSTIGVYQFESDGFVRQVPWSRDAMVAIGMETEKSLVLVAWGNLQTDTLQVIPPSVGAPPDSARVSLRTKADGYQFPAPDLFYGRYESTDETTRSAQTQTFSLVMERKVSALSVRILHLAEHFGGVSGDLRLLVRGTCVSLDFRGKPTAETTVYSPALQVVSGADEWGIPLFRVFPTSDDSTIRLDLYRNDELVLSTTTDYDGNSLLALPGKETHITVDFRYARLRVGMSVEPWGGNTDQEVMF